MSPGCSRGTWDCIVARVFRHEHLQELAKYAEVPVINALSDWEHPCQTMADLLTIREHKGGLDGLTLTFVGDGNNVARSLCLGAAGSGNELQLRLTEGIRTGRGIGSSCEGARQRYGADHSLAIGGGY